MQADIRPWLMSAEGIAVRVQGLKRFYALQLAEGRKVRLIKALDGDKILGEQVFDWEVYKTYSLKIKVAGNQIKAWVDDELLFDIQDLDNPLIGGGVAYILDQGHFSSQAMIIRPAAD